MLLKRKLIVTCALMAFSRTILAKLVDFQMLNTLKKPVEYAPLGIRSNPPSALLLGKDGRILKENTALLKSNGGTYNTQVDTDQFPRILIRLKGNSIIKMYEFTPGSYDKIYVRIVDGPNFEPQTSNGLAIKGNIKANFIREVAQGTTASMQSPAEEALKNKQIWDNIFKKNLDEHKKMDQEFLDTLKKKLSNHETTVNDIDKTTSMSPLMVAADKNYSEAVKFLLGQGADVNAHDTHLGRTALMYAARNGWKDIIKLLLDHGADMYAQDENGDTAFDLSLSDENIFLIFINNKQFKLGTILQDSGKTLLMMAIATQKNNLAKALIKRGENVNAVNTKDKNMTALMYAAQQGNSVGVRSLLDAGANTSMKNSDDKTALQLSKDTTIINMFKK